MLIEAGHIAQNIMLAATDEGFVASPTAALAHDDISNLLGNSDPLVSPIYALVLGYSSVNRTVDPDEMHTHHLPNSKTTRGNAEQ